MGRNNSWYDTAEICLNGHVISEYAISQPEHHQAYCEDCGATTIQSCPTCGTSIRGYYHIPDALIFLPYEPPAFCYSCGKPFPWTEARLQAARELIEELDELSLDEKKKFNESFADVITDTPRTSLAATRFSKYIAKMGTGAAAAMREIFVDIASETAKKIIWPNG